MLEVKNAISILLSSDFLIMSELSEKCVFFIANNLQAILQVPCVFTSIPERLLAKLGACIPATRLSELVDKKDKIKTRLFQRKIEFMFDISKLKRIFEPTADSNNSKTSAYILNEWLKNPSSGSYLNYLYECENDASDLFKCKLCNRFMTRSQSQHLKCSHSLLDRHGELIYMHCSDESLDLIGFLRLVKEQLVTWEAVYWFIWCLIKSFQCKKCLKWFRLVDANKCRLNEFTICAVHDVKESATNSSATAQCTCMYAEHLINTDSATELYSKSQFVLNPVSDLEPTSANARLANFVNFQIDTFTRFKEIVLTTSNNEKSPCDLIEAVTESKVPQVSLDKSFNKTSKYGFNLLFYSVKLQICIHLL